jgi:hypothetical protein
VELSPVNVRDPAEIERAVSAFARSANGGLIVTASPLLAHIQITSTKVRFQRQRTAMIQRGKARSIRERRLKDWGRRMSSFRAGCGLLASPGID